MSRSARGAAVARVAPAAALKAAGAVASLQAAGAVASAAAVTPAAVPAGVPVPDEQVGSLEEARKVIRELRERSRAQAAQLLAWRRRVKAQEEMVARVARERSQHLGALAAQLLMCEARLARKQKDISSLLGAREAVILRQQRQIRALQTRLSAAGLDASLPSGPPATMVARSGGSLRGRTRLSSAGVGGGGDDGLEDDVDEDEDGACEDPLELLGGVGVAAALDSLNDSDSAVVLEEALGSDADVLSVLPRLRSAGLDPAVTVVRSVSDAVEPANKFSSLRRCNGLLRRPEVLETVYSVEEDADGDTAADCSAANGVNGSDSHGDTRAAAPARGNRLQELYGSYERLHEAPPGTDGSQYQYQRHGGAPPARDLHNPVTTYNRVMSNHRSVTKPKDVKYKRINKAKSKSLEELRGRLRNWVDKGSKLTVSLDQSYA